MATNAVRLQLACARCSLDGQLLALHVALLCWLHTHLIPLFQACMCATMQACCALQVLSQGSPAASPGGVLQLWLEGNFLLAALAGMGRDALAQAYHHLRTALDSRLEEALAAAEGGAQAATLAAWAQGCSNMRLAVPTCPQRLEGVLEQVQAMARSNLTSLHQLIASTCEFRS